MPLSDTEILAFLPSIRRRARVFAKGSRLDPEDLAQGAVEKIIRAVRNGSEITDPAWMMSVAKHHFIDEARWAKRRPTEPLAEGEDKEQDYVRANGDDAVALSEALEVLDQTADGRDLVAFVIDGSHPERKKARFNTRRDLRRAMR